MKKFFLIPLMTLCTCVMAFAVDITSRSELQSFLEADGTNSGVIAANLDLTAEGAHFLVAGTKELTINDGVTLSLTSAYNEQEEEQPNGYDGHGFCFYVQDGAKLTVKGNGTIAADRSVFFVEEGGELTIGEVSKATQLKVTTSVSNVKQRMVVAKGVASLYNANMSGRSGAIWSNAKLLIDGGTYLAKSSSTDNVAPLTAQHTYAVNAQGYSVILKNATIKGVHGGVAPAAGGHVEVDNCTLIADQNFADNPSGAASYYGLYGATYAICIVRNSKIYSSNGYSIYIGNNDSQHTFGLVYLYENCYLHGNTAAKAYPLVQKREKTDYEILFPIEIAPTSAWYTVADKGSNSTTRRMPLPSNVEYLAKDTVIDGLTYQLRTVSTIPAEKHEELAPTTEETIPWQQTTTWSDSSVPTDESAVNIPEGKTVVVDKNNAEKTAEANQVNLQGEGASLTVQEGTTLNVTNGMNIAVGAKLVVDAGAVVTVGEGGVIAGSDDAIEVKTQEGKTGTFMIAPTVNENTHPMAKVELVSKAYKRGEDDFVYQRFGIPAYMQGLKRSDMQYDHVAAPTAVWKLDYANKTWADMADDDEFIPFRCYELTTTAATPGAVYTFSCPLMGNGNAELELNGEWNYYANSYTAPIDVKELIKSFDANYDHMSATVYLYRASDNWWYELNEMAYLFDFGHELPTKIDPMQAFIFQKRGDGANPEVNYKKNVWDPIMNPGASPAPARDRKSYNKALIEITAADGTKDAIRLVENGQFSAAFDNSYDAAKYMNENSFNLFVDANDEKLGSVATDNFNGTTISMTTKGQTSFTMTISHVDGMNYAVRDMLTGTEIEMVEGATYMFSVPANANVEGRFQIVSINKMPTAIENIEATAAVKGIYTITGQFVGNDYHSLPNGIYVVDGKKIVK